MPWYSPGSKKHDAYYARLMHIMMHVYVSIMHHAPFIMFFGKSNKTVNLTPFKRIKFEVIGYLLCYAIQSESIMHHTSCIISKQYSTSCTYNSELG